MIKFGKFLQTNGYGFKCIAIGVTLLLHLDLHRCVRLLTTVKMLRTTRNVLPQQSAAAMFYEPAVDL